MKYEITFFFDHKTFDQEIDQETYVRTIGKFRVSEDALDSYLKGLKSDESWGKVSDIEVRAM